MLVRCWPRCTKPLLVDIQQRLHGLRRQVEGRLRVRVDNVPAVGRYQVVILRIEEVATDIVSDDDARMLSSVMSPHQRVERASRETQNNHLFFQGLNLHPKGVLLAQRPIAVGQGC
ncbi:hypothetical protein D9M71_686610 [compost metagenome]